MDKLKIRVRLDGYPDPVLFTRQKDQWYVNHSLDLIINPEMAQCVDRNWYADYVSEPFTYNFNVLEV